jgi:DNA-directed RNA polymerase delta subunit
MQNMIDDRSVLKRGTKYLDTELDDEVILMQVESGQIFGMAETAQEIWTRLSEPVTFGKLLDDLVEHFDVDRATCAAEVSRFLVELQNQEFIEISAT